MNTEKMEPAGSEIIMPSARGPHHRRFQLANVRFLVLGLSILCLMLIYSNSLLLNFTIICMDSNNFTAWHRSALLSATAFGSILGGLPIQQFAGRFSLRFVITIYGLLSALSTLAIPLVAFTTIRFPAIFFARVLQGTAFPAQFVTSSAVSRKWAPPELTSTFLLLCSTHFELGPMLTMPAAGFFCESRWGWTAIYYIQGALSLALFSLFFALFRDSPEQHPWITKPELEFICGKERSHNKLQEAAPPYKAIFSDWAVWLVMFAFASDDFGYQFYTEMGPYYLNKVLGIGVGHTGLYAALNYLIALFCALLIGPVNDKLLSAFSQNFRVKMFAAIAQYGMALSLAYLALVPSVTHSLWAMIPVYVLLNSFTTLDFLGVIRCAQTISLRHSELLIAWQSVISGCIAIVLPPLVSLLTPNDSLSEWKFVFFGIALMQITVVSSFILIGETGPRKWAIEESHQQNTADEDDNNGRMAQNRQRD